MKRIILDTDPGVDDALAIMLALNSPELKVEAITTVAGNVPHDTGHTNALKILEFLGIQDFPVAKGAVKPLFRENVFAERVHGRGGLGDVVLPEPGLRSDERSAIEVITDLAENLREELTLVAVGPLTNIASAIITKPEIVGMVERLVIMGGAFNVTPYGHGNQTPVAEFNVWFDPEAAKLVFNSGIRLTAIGLDVTTEPQSCLMVDHFNEIKKIGTERADLVANLIRKHIREFGRAHIHDPMAVAEVIDPTLYRKKRIHVNVETSGELTRGETVSDRRPPHRATIGEANVEVCTDVEGGRFLSLFMNRVARC